MDFHSVMETFAEAWVAANTHTPLTEAAGQGLINGPANHGSNNQGQGPPPNHGSNSQSQGQPPNHISNSQSQGQSPNQGSNGQNQGQPINLGLNCQSHGQPLNLGLNCQNQGQPLNLGLNCQSQGQPLNLESNCQNQGQPPAVSLPESKQQTETVTIVENNKVSERQSPSDSPSNCSSVGEIIKPYKVQEAHGKCLPVHCIIEQIPGPQACGQYVELDSYAIVPNDTLFSDLVRTALGKLGYSGAQILGAKGSIQVKKWKPLAFDQITENPEATVGDILGDLTTMASLHVRLYSVPDNPDEWRDITVRNAVLELLREMSQSKLAKLCPLSQPMLSNIINNRYMGKIGKEKCQEFGQWYLAYRKQHPEGSTPEVVPSDKPVDGRLTFHPTKELPVMRDWFHGCRNPSRRTLQMYVDILNQGTVRQQERPKISLSTLKNWWKNEKQRERKHQRSDDQSPETSKPKRRKKADGSNTQKEASSDVGIQNFSGSSSQDSPLKSNSFTLINHSETESDLERFTRKDGELSESSLVSDSGHHFTGSNPTEVAKTNSKFSLLSHNDHGSDIDRHVRNESEISESKLNGHIIHSIKDSIPVESPFFHKLHPVCIDHPHSIFSFPDPHLSIQNSSKIYCDNSERTNIEGSNSRLSSEEDVDVGI
ncbi:DNA-binding protein SATB1 [Nephila pilipes]|uniref:DNA-binding protein SATB1 n=1 Tax=Nephila pilipes TaxID=299642 RepID=A0A8X6Q450_NEPPI|nr:DNA-binding protein SATB1 [Nephila pilipes]